MAVSMQSVITDIEAETAALRGLVAPLTEGPRGWDAPTPAVGWTIRDQISHLAFFDDVAVRSATDPDGFSSDYLPMMADGAISPDVIAERYRQMPAADLLAWFDTSRAALVAAFADIDPATRLPWFGPPMSAERGLVADSATHGDLGARPGRRRRARRDPRGHGTAASRGPHRGGCTRVQLPGQRSGPARGPGTR
ncbi:maleylpyruvate isomerase N-terminal domain-containing protein [Mycobacteroides abscessus]|uniref:maleylpyruvate isomerase N-terminal domain-containing protein n=1 Tax=Mycobacteroides abscessus TaxID=36809 RepID=UPI0002F36EC8